LDYKPAPRSVFWVLADTGGTTVISLISILIMARLIGPTDFGSAAIAVGFVQIANLYVEGLLHDALIQNSNVKESAFEEAFWFVAAIGLAIALFAGIATFFVHGATARPLALLIFGSTLSLPFSGMSGACNARSRREMDYKLVAAPSVAAKLLSAVSGLAAAAAGLGPWSLVIQLIVGAAVQSIGLLMMSGWRPKLRFTISSLKPLWAFALPYAVMHTLVGLRAQGFVSLTAAFGGLAAAGYVNVAFRLTLAPQILLATSLTNIGLPLLAREQHNRARLESAFQNLNRTVAFGLPIAFLGLALCAHPIVHALLGSEWLPSVLPMQAFAVVAAIYFLRMPSALLLRSLGYVRYSLMNAIMHLVVTLGGMLLFHPQTTVLASLLWILPIVPLMPITIYVVSRRVGLSVSSQFRGLLAPIGCTAVALSAVIVVETLLRSSSDVIVLAASVTTGVLVYIGLVVQFSSEIRRIAISQYSFLFRRLSGLVR
jgi:O-antigen/teichoic acid export membrane protein